MAATALIFCALIGGTSETSANPADLAAYQTVKAHAGRDADSQIKLALWCEAHGLQAERVKHLALAVLSDPKNATARGLMGLVDYAGRWERPDSVVEKVKADAQLSAVLAEYNARRETTPNTADAQYKLALWCEEKRLKAEALAHFTTVVRLDPSREAAWKRLGYKKVGTRWLSESETFMEKQEAEARKQADRLWKPRLTKYREALSAKDAAKRAEATAALDAVTDPRAAVSVWSVFVAGSPKTHDRAVVLFGQIDAPAASRALALLAAFDASPEVRRAATETLKRRDAREFADVLIGFIRDPIKYHVEPVQGPGTTGKLVIEGKAERRLRLYAAPGIPTIPNLPGLHVEYDENGLPVVRGAGRLRPLQISWTEIQNLPEPLANWAQASLLTNQPISSTSFIMKGGRYVYDVPIGKLAVEAVRSANAAKLQLEGDADEIERYNEMVGKINTPVCSVLKEATGQDLGADSEAWETWRSDQLGFRILAQKEADEKPTVVENVAPTYQRTTPYVAASQINGFVRVSCFGAGTLVRTLNGPRPIETLKVGDRVLTQDINTAALGYQPITVVHHNPPSPTFLVKIKGDTIVSSPFHRFWSVGRGWIMARDLKGGETLRLLDGPATVEAVESGPVQPVFNLDVADAHDFFAGSAAALVHDNTLPDTRLQPFDATPAFSTGLSVKTGENSR